jgi:hypothetical protein
MDDSRRRYFDRFFFFTGQGDKWRNDQIARIDEVLSRGVVEPLLESSIVTTLLKSLFL